MTTNTYARMVVDLFAVGIAAIPRRLGSHLCWKGQSGPENSGKLLYRPEHSELARLGSTSG